MSWLMIPLTVLAFAFLINGFPNIIINRNYRDKRKGD